MYNYGPCSMKCSKLNGFNSAGVIAPGESLDYFVASQSQYNLNCIKFFTMPIMLHDKLSITALREIIPKPINYYNTPRDPYTFIYDNKLMYNIDVDNIKNHSNIDIANSLTFSDCVYDPNTLEYIADINFVKVHSESIFANTSIIKIDNTHHKSINSTIEIKTSGIKLMILVNDNGVFFQIEITETTYIDKEYKKVKHNIIDETIIKGSEFDPAFKYSHQHIEYDLTSNILTIFHEQQNDDGSIITDKTFTIDSEYFLKFSTFTLHSSFLFNDLNNFNKFKYELWYSGDEYPILDNELEPVDIKLGLQLDKLLNTNNATNFILSGAAYFDEKDDFQYDAYMPMAKYLIEWKDDNGNIISSDRMKQGSLQHMFEPFTKKYPFDHRKDMHYVYEKIKSLVIDKISFADNVEQRINHEYLINDSNAEYIKSTNISDKDLLISISDRSVKYDDEMIQKCLLQKVRMTNLGSKFLTQMLQNIEPFSIIGINLYLYGDTDTIHNGGYVIDWDGQHDGEGLYPGLYIPFKNLKLFKTKVTPEGNISFQILTNRITEYTNIQENSALNISGYEIIVDFDGTIGALARIFYKDNQIMNPTEPLSLGFTIKIR